MICINNNSSHTETRHTIQKPNASSVEKTSSVWSNFFDKLLSLLANLFPGCFSSKKRSIVNLTNRDMQGKVIKIIPKTSCLDGLDNPLPTVKNKWTEIDEGKEIPLNWIMHPYIERILNPEDNNDKIKSILNNLKEVKASDLDETIVENIINSLSHRTVKTELKILNILDALARTSDKDQVLANLEQLANVGELDNLECYPSLTDEEIQQIWKKFRRDGSPQSLKRGRSLTI